MSLALVVVSMAGAVSLALAVLGPAVVAPLPVAAPILVVAPDPEAADLGFAAVLAHLPAVALEVGTWDAVVRALAAALPALAVVALVVGRRPVSVELAGPGVVDRMADVVPVFGATQAAVVLVAGARAEARTVAGYLVAARPTAVQEVAVQEVAVQDVAR